MTTTHQLFTCPAGCGRTTNNPGSMAAHIAAKHGDSWTVIRRAELAQLQACHDPVPAVVMTGDVQCQGCGAIRDGSWLGKPHNCWRNADGTLEEGGTFQ